MFSAFDISNVSLQHSRIFKHSHCNCTVDQLVTKAVGRFRLHALQLPSVSIASRDHALDLLAPVIVFHVVSNAPLVEAGQCAARLEVRNDARGGGRVHVAGT
jgi:hypothetical protein